MSGRGDRLELGIADDEPVSGVEETARRTGAASLRQVRRRPCRVYEARAAGDVVSVNGGVENVPNRKPVRLGQRQVGAYVPLGVDHRRLPRVGDDIRGAT